MFCSSGQQTQARSAIVDLGSLPLAAFLFFFIGKILNPNANLNIKTWKMKWFWRFSSTKSEGKSKVKIARFLYIWFSVCSKNYTRMTAKGFVLYIWYVYSHIFAYIFLGLIATFSISSYDEHHFGYKEKLLKKQWASAWRSCKINRGAINVHKFFIWTVQARIYCWVWQPWGMGQSMLHPSKLCHQPEV